jgi:hypothetical protein
MGVVSMVEQSKSLWKNALVGFALGLLVVSGLTVATWNTRAQSSHAK